MVDIMVSDFMKERYNFMICVDTDIAKPNHFATEISSTRTATLSVLNGRSTMLITLLDTFTVLCQEYMLNYIQDTLLPPKLEKIFVTLCLTLYSRSSSFLTFHSLTYLRKGDTKHFYFCFVRSLNSITILLPFDVKT